MVLKEEEEEVPHNCEQVISVFRSAGSLIFFNFLTMLDTYACCGIAVLTQQHGWVLDPASQMLTVRPMSSVANKKTDSSQLQNLTEYVFHLEH